ncbi:hypothetical protein K4039_11060 [Lyngbya sp. CCAP 1446/10]|uniref:hypothetical protein n=1 Tax=Microcoleaceae TaxID=1892252 RepID=UPI002238063C|nr:hypothetical protein [Lyngbya sp. CCAP 1446/10]MCW6050607.1 hypothetical protein [Lyngbya sp. CCAP 1446/10]
MPVALKRFAAALRVLSFGMGWCYLDTSSNGITFLVLSAREICGLRFRESVGGRSRDHIGFAQPQIVEF